MAWDPFGCGALEDALAGLTARVTALERKVGEHMATVAQDLEALRAALDDATNKVAAEIATLKGQVKNSMTDAEVTALKAGLQASADRLNGLAADPMNPVP